MEVVAGGEALKDSVAGLFGSHRCGLFGGTLNHPGVGKNSLNGQSVHGVVLQQPGNQIFGSVTDVCVCRVGVLHLDDKDTSCINTTADIILK